MDQLTAFQQPHHCHSVAFTVDHLAVFQQPQNRFQQHVQKEQPKHLAYVLARIHDIDESLASLLESSSAGGASAGAQGPGREDNSVEILKGKLEQLEQQVQQYLRQGGASTVGGATGGFSQASGGAEASATADVSCVPFNFRSLMCVFCCFGLVWYFFACLAALSLSLSLALSLFLNSDQQQLWC